MQVILSLTCARGLIQYLSVSQDYVSCVQPTWLLTNNNNETQTPVRAGPFCQEILCTQFYANKWAHITLYIYIYIYTGTYMDTFMQVDYLCA